MITVDCIWNEWRWSPCSETCGNGTQNATRTYAQEALHGGANCTGNSSDSRNCSPNPCPGSEFTSYPLFLKVIVSTGFNIVQFHKYAFIYISVTISELHMGRVGWLGFVLQGMRRGQQSAFKVCLRRGHVRWNMPGISI